MKVPDRPIITFSAEEKALLIPKVQKYLRDELDCEVGGFDAEFLLDFFSKEVGAFIYNRALTDVQFLLEKQRDAVAEAIYQLEKPVSFEKE